MTIIDYEPRFVIWPCVIDATKNEEFNFFLGCKDELWIENNLGNCYAEKIEKKSKRDWFVESKFNSHSQYLDFFLKVGIVGFLLFFLFTIKLFMNARLNFYTFAISFSMISFFLVENVLYRQFGVYTVAIMLSVIEKIKHEKN